jgi:hypothetical protein
MEIMLGTSPKNPYVVLKYLGGLYNDLRKKVILFKPMNVDEAYVKENYLEIIGHTKGNPSGLK